MKHMTTLITILAIAACGGSKPPPPAEPKEAEPEPAPAAETKPAPEPEPAAESEPAPAPAPKSWNARAQLAPIKGTKIKGTTVTFAQQEGQPVELGSMGWFDGIKPGKYHLVVHEGADCGASAAKAGKPIATSDIAFSATKGVDSLSVQPSSAISLDGDAAIVGHTLVLHADAKGKPGRALACGPIAAAE